jgi:hypothetical protein
MTRPAPLTPPDSDLSDFGFMPLDVGRFRRSDLVTQEEPEAIVAAVLLWGAAWHSKPAASLSNDDRTLAQAAGFGRAVAAFQAIKAGALRGFVECSDGRLYHPVVAEKAREAWLAKLRRAWQVECSRLRKWNERHPDDKRATPTFEAWLEERNASRETLSEVASDKSDASRATSAEGHARHDSDVETVTRDGHPEPDLVETLPRASVQEQPAADERNGASQGQLANVERDTAIDSRARAGKGQGEGQGEGQGDSKSLRSASTPTGDDAETDTAEEDPRNLVGRVARLARLAGLNVTVPAKLSQAIDMLKSWEAEGIDFEATIVPTIESRTRDNPSEPVFSLRYFDAAVRKAHGVKASGGRPSAPAGPAKPKEPIAKADGEDPRVERFRSRLAYAVGETRYAQRYGPDAVAIEVIDGRLLEVYFRTGAEERLAEMDEQTMREVAARLGLSLRTRALA